MPSNDIAINVENISKRYRIGLKEELHDSFGGAIFDFIKSPLKNYRRYRSLYKFDDIKPEFNQHVKTNSPDIIWALRDVSFKVKRGEVIGIIGRNGAGKSTLLKVLSRITELTHGHAEIRGRISTLLEVGTGFHPELTGRENIYLNGTILGMTKRDVEDRFDDIVEFSGVEKFIDTPVKRYSSGMKVRLAFSVSAHLEPEILMIDEVLAVGDASFQKKCLGKMNTVAREGRTVLFVSHNMSAIQALCSSAILLEDGQLVFQGKPNQVIADYLKKTQTLAKSISLGERIDRRGNGTIRFQGVQFYGEEGMEISFGQTGKQLSIGLQYVLKVKSNCSCVFQIIFNDMFGQRLFTCLTRASYNGSIEIQKSGEIRCRIPKLPLLPGRYICTINCKTNESLADYVDEAFFLDVMDGDFFGTGKLQPNDSGHMLVSHSWEFR